MVWSLQTTPTLSAAQFEQWSNLLEERMGMQLKPQQRSLLQTQLAMRMRELKCSDVEVYFRQVQQDRQGSAEWRVLINRMTVNETRFFRHPASFNLVRQHLNDLLELGQPHLNLWSVGCATGEEAYSLAMLADESIETQSALSDYSVCATDISSKAIGLAELGEYSNTAAEQLRPNFVDKYFHTHATGLNVQERLKKHVQFSCDNILNLKATDGELMDVIFCQNMLIYFQDWRKENVLDALAERLKPGGILLVGLGETLSWKNDKLDVHNNKEVQAYQRLRT
jgi:chemotaxis protein methyltransferase CheR/type IV pilus assembly protein PilK